MDRKNDGPTVFDINKPHTVGATASSRPVIVGHRPMMPDPMVNPTQAPDSPGTKIDIKVGETETKMNEKLPSADVFSPNVDAKSLAGALFPETDGEQKATSSSALMEGEPQLSPPFSPDGDPESAAQRAPYMPVSDLTGINLEPGSKTSQEDNDDRLKVGPVAGVFGSNNDNLVKTSKESKQRKSRSKLWLFIVLILVVLAGVYAAIDKGLILGNINLPVHIFKRSEPAPVPDTSSAATTSPASVQATVPAGFTQTRLVEASLTFAYPTAWGAPNATVDQGFSTRTAKAKPDSNYAFLLSFPNNKDVQLAITSAKYLPSRAAAQYLYYDYLGWCVGSADAKFYVGVLRYSTVNGTDSPSTVTCDQGPLSNVNKLNSDTIVQANLKNTDGTIAGDIYTKNLKNTSYVVFRAKDATMKNSDSIKAILDSVQSTQ